MSTSKIIAMLVMCVGVPVVFGLLACLLRRTIGCDCHRCGNSMTAFKWLPDADQRAILEHFEKVERRTPDTTAIFACGVCGTVYDDFSGEKKSLDGDNISICKVCGKPWVGYLGSFVSLVMYEDVYRRLVEANKKFVDKIECLRCERKPKDSDDCISCDTPLKVTGCRYCSTLYLWGPLERSKYKFLLPLTEQTILARAEDPTPGDL